MLLFFDVLLYAISLTYHNNRLPFLDSLRRFLLSINGRWLRGRSSLLFPLLRTVLLVERVRLYLNCGHLSLPEGGHLALATLVFVLSMCCFGLRRRL